MLLVRLLKLSVYLHNSSETPEEKVQGSPEEKETPSHLSLSVSEKVNPGFI